MQAAWAWWVIPNWGAATPFPTTELHYYGSGGSGEGVAAGCSCPRFVWIEKKLQITVWGGTPESEANLLVWGALPPHGGIVVWRCLDQSFSDMSKHTTPPLPRPQRLVKRRF